MNPDGAHARIRISYGITVFVVSRWNATRVCISPDGKKILFGRFIPYVSNRLYLPDVETLEVEPGFPRVS